MLSLFDDSGNPGFAINLLTNFPDCMWLGQSQSSFGVTTAQEKI
jgi:hypothetical protein